MDAHWGNTSALGVPLDDEPGGMRRDDRLRLATIHKTRMEGVRKKAAEAEPERAASSAAVWRMQHKEDEKLALLRERVGEPVPESLVGELAGAFAREKKRKVAAQIAEDERFARDLLQEEHDDRQKRFKRCMEDEAFARQLATQG